MEIKIGDAVRQSKDKTSKIGIVLKIIDESAHSLS